MPAPFMADIESSCISRTEPLHTFGEICSNGFQKKMKMISHENVCVKIQIESLGRFFHQANKLDSVRIVEK